MEQEEPPEPVPEETMRRWYEDANKDLMVSVGAHLPPFGERRQSTRKTRCSVTDSDIPRGNLFYPCCGKDTLFPITTFGACVDTCIFADPKNHGRAVYVGKPEHPGIGAIRTIEGVDGQRVRYGPDNSLTYVKDGLLCFIENVEELSVFFYRGDSGGECGSDQRWLGPVLFNAVLAKLLAGGLIVTDGSNCGYYNSSWGEYVPWNAMAGLEPFGAPSVGTSFEYDDRIFRCLAGPFEGAHGGRSTYVWQMHC